MPSSQYSGPPQGATATVYRCKRGDEEFAPWHQCFAAWIAFSKLLGWFMYRYWRQHSGCFFFKMKTCEAVKVIDLHRFSLHQSYEKMRHHIMREMSLLLMLQHRWDCIDLHDIMFSGFRMGKNPWTSQSLTAQIGQRDEIQGSIFFFGCPLFNNQPLVF